MGCIALSLEMTFNDLMSAISCLWLLADNASGLLWERDWKTVQIG